MVNLRMLCERYCVIDDELKELRVKIDEADVSNRDKYLAEYISMYVKREDFKSGMRRQLINELVEGIKDPNKLG